jgi:hypothetical protein
MSREVGKPTLSAQDDVEIRELSSRYYWLADTSPGVRWATELFTPDRMWWIGTDKGGQQAAGTKQLAEISLRMSGKLPEPQRPQHMCTNLSIEPSTEGARGRCYFWFIFSAPGKPPTSRRRHGTYADVVVKTPDGWGFKCRKMCQSDISGIPDRPRGPRRKSPKSYRQWGLGAIRCRGVFHQ